jgi:hypothetical protein
VCLNSTRNTYNLRMYNYSRRYAHRSLPGWIRARCFDGAISHGNGQRTCRVPDASIVPSAQANGRWQLASPGPPVDGGARSASLGWSLGIGTKPACLHALKAGDDTGTRADRTIA